MIISQMRLSSVRRTKKKTDATILLNIPGVIHLFVASFSAHLGVLLGILVTPKALMVILVGGVGEPLNLFPEFLPGVRKHPVSGPQAMPMKASSPIDDLDKQVPILVFMKLDFPRLLSEFHLGEGRWGALLKCLPDRELVGGGIDLFFGLFVPKSGGSFRGAFVKN